MLLATGVQIYSQYRSEVSKVDEQFAFIRTSYLPSLVNSVWQLDDEQVQIQLEGLLNLPFIDQLTITTDGVDRWRAGKKAADRDAVMSAELRHEHRGTTHTLGVLHISASFAQIYDRLLDQAMFVFLSNGLKTLLVVVFFIWLFHSQVTRHILAISDFLSRIDVANISGPDLQLDRKSDREYRDILDLLVESANGLRRSLSNSLTNLARAQRMARLGNWEFDAKSRRLSWSDEIHRIFGVKKDEFDGSAENLYSHIPVEERPRVQEIFETALKQNKTAEYEHKIVRADGEERTVYQQIEVEPGENGQSTIVHGTLQDITERKFLENELLHAQRVQAIGQLTGGIAHDFNNLLTVHFGLTDLLAHRLSSDTEAQALLEKLIATSQRGASLTNRLLSFSRRQLLTSRPTDIEALISNVGELLGSTLSADVVLDIQCEPGLWNGLVDPPQLENALVNLAINARDAMLDGGTLSIEARNAHLDRPYSANGEEIGAGDYVKVSVRDTGTGIEPEVLEHIFEPYFTTKGAGEGSGLGLSMVYGFIRQSEGQITISSEFGVGTTFDLYLPRSSDAPDGKPVTEKAATPIEPGIGRILIVEDDELVRAVPVYILERNGYVVVEASTFAAAQALLKDNGPFDLLFTDMILPGSPGGVELSIQAVKIQPGIKVILTTGYSGEVLSSKTANFSFEYILKKPYRRVELLEMVATVLGEPPR